MWVPRHCLELIFRNQDDLERRVKRLELIALRNANDTVASLHDKEAGLMTRDGVSTIEEIINEEESPWMQKKQRGRRPGSLDIESR